MSEGLAFNLNQQFETMICCNCKMMFAVPSSVRREWIASGGSFWCPNGHSQHYTESDVQKLKKQLEEANRNRDWYKQRQANERAAREATERRLIAQKAAKTRLKNRINNGVCPCCTRTFANLASHMKTKHPQFNGAEQ
jgi:NMD protein affecting ribosome stability and mRNA decay